MLGLYKFNDILSMLISWWSGEQIKGEILHMVSSIGAKFDQNLSKIEQTMENS